MGQSLHKDYYVDHLAAVNRNNRVLATKDIKNEQGAVLVAKGTAITAEIARKIAHHKLLQPLETSVALESALTPRQVIAHQQTLPKNPDLWRLQEQHTVLNDVFCQHCECLAKYPPISQKLTVFADRLPIFFEKTLTCAYIALLLAGELKLSEEVSNHIFLAAMTRDLGLLHIDPDIVRSHQPLTPQQWRLLQGHVAVSHHFLAIVPTLPKAVSRAVLEHHERCDGLGYPYGKLGDELCLEGQVVALADMIVALITKQVDTLGYSMRAIIPVLQLNLSVHFNRVTDAAICALRALVTDCDRVYDNCEIPAVIETIIARQQPLASWFEQICALIRDTSAHADSKHIRITNAYLARIQATLISSGMITREQRCWLEDVLNNSRVEEYFDVECTELMLNEVCWQFRQLNNTLVLAIQQLQPTGSNRDYLYKQSIGLDRKLNNLLSTARDTA